MAKPSRAERKAANAAKVANNKGSFAAGRGSGYNTGKVGGWAKTPKNTKAVKLVAKAKKKMGSAAG